MSIANKTGDNVLSQNPINKFKLVMRNGNERTRYMSGASNILSPLYGEGGIVFQTTPSISIVYNASYTPYELMHSNYEINAYQKSAINDLNIQKATFTAETREKADYLLAVMHFFKTFTKMNYGINDPRRGVPPQILHFSGYGEYMFNHVPVAIKSYTMSLPDDTDMVQTSHKTQVPIVVDLTVNLTFMPTPSKVRSDFSLTEFANGNLAKRGYL